MSTQQLILLLLGGATSASLFVYTAYSIVFASKLRTDDRLYSITQLDAEPELHLVGAEAQALPFSVRLVRAAGAVSQKMKIGQKGKAKTQLKLMRAGILMKPEELTGVTILSGVVVTIIFMALTGNIPLGLIGMIPGYILPHLVVMIKMKKRAKKLSDQLPDALSVIANGIRAGFSFTQAVSLVVKEMEAPISEEFGKLLKENAMGKPMEEALTALSQRTGDEDLDIVITALLIQRQVGGSLAEILDIIATTIRERIKLKGDIRTMTAQGKMSAGIVSVMPVAMGIMMSVVSPGYMDPMFGSLIGMIMLGVAAGSVGFGIIVLSKIVKINV